MQLFFFFSGENAHPTNRHRERFLFRGRAHRYRALGHTVPRTRVLRRVHHSHGVIRIRVRVRDGIHQREQTGGERREQKGAAEGHVLCGFPQGLFQPQPHQRGRPGDFQGRTAQPKTKNHFLDGRCHRRNGSFTRLVNSNKYVRCGYAFHFNR